MFWKKEIECISRSDLDKLQAKQLALSVKRAANSVVYRERFAKAGITSLDNMEQLAMLPFTTKDDLRAAFPTGFLCVPLDKAVRLHSSSGTTGNPTVVYHTMHDLEAWADLVARSLYMTGCRPGDVFQNMMGYGLFTGGLGLHYGAEKLGMLTIPIGPGNTQRQIWFMQQFRTTVAHILPSYALRLALALADAKLMPGVDIKLRTVIIGAEPHTEGVRKKIEEMLCVKAFNCYGLSEMCGPGVAFECQEQDGLHIWEDHFLVEIIDPQTGEVLPDGQEGELVLTSLEREAMPLLRYRTRDLTAVIPGRCGCGRTHRRIRRIKGRDDDMLIINGVNCFPMQIEMVLMKIPGVGNNYVIELRKENHMDKLTVKVEVHETMFKGTLEDLEKLEQHIAALLKAEILFTPYVRLVEPGSIPVAEGKVKRVIDLRKTE
ncbi:MAG: phenylacetate--CoA ligase [Spirochaetaceae bacterium]|nr:MAG: phenylacetate--CoA ligase [Spirochaetaceae bacterium]